MYLYHSIGFEENTLDFHLSKTRDKDYANCFGLTPVKQTDLKKLRIGCFNSLIVWIRCALEALP